MRLAQAWFLRAPLTLKAPAGRSVFHFTQMQRHVFNLVVINPELAFRHDVADAGNVEHVSLGRDALNLHVRVLEGLLFIVVKSNSGHMRQGKVYSPILSAAKNWKTKQWARDETLRSLC
jgi:hypothetical protein